MFQHAMLLWLSYFLSLFEKGETSMTRSHSAFDVSINLQGWGFDKILSYSFKIKGPSLTICEGRKDQNHFLTQRKS